MTRIRTEQQDVPKTGWHALFCGPSGTSKSVAAAVLAAELHRPLCRLTLSSFQQEAKQLRHNEISGLHHASACNAVIEISHHCTSSASKDVTNPMFVSDSHLSAVLSFLDTYSGVVVFTVEQYQSIPKALLRRLSLHLRFHPSRGADQESMICTAVEEAADAVKFEAPAT